MVNIMHTPFLPLHPGQSNASSSICFLVLPSFGLGGLFSRRTNYWSLGVLLRGVWLHFLLIRRNGGEEGSWHDLGLS